MMTDEKSLHVTELPMLSELRSHQKKLRPKDFVPGGIHPISHLGNLVSEQHFNCHQ